MTHITDVEKSELVKSIKLDWSEQDEPVKKRVTTWFFAIPLLLIAGALIAYYWPSDSGIPIRVATVKYHAVKGATTRGSTALDGSGYIVARRKATVSSKATARVLEVLVEEGQEVKEGQVIARLDDSDTLLALSLAEAQLGQESKNYEATVLAFDNAKPIFERNQMLVRSNSISDLEFDSAKAIFDDIRMKMEIAKTKVEVAKVVLDKAKQNQKDTIIRAPFDGVLTVKAAQAGETISPISAGGGFTRTGIGTIVDMDSLELEVDISENFINRLSPGQLASVKLNAYPEWDIPAKVITIVPTADKTKATIKVRVSLEQEDPRIIPEMGARVSFLNDVVNEPNMQDTTRLVVPATAVWKEDGVSKVFVVNGNVVNEKVVKLGGNIEAGQIVLSGVKSGDLLAIGNLQDLRNKSQIQIIE